MVDQIPVLWDEVFLEHEPPAGEFESGWTGRLAVREAHPDKPERVQNIKHIPTHELGEYCELEAVTPATREQLHRVHAAEYVDELEAFCEAGGGRLTAETGANDQTFTAARYAAGAAVGAAQRAADSTSTAVPYALVRPSGHHAQPSQADGFCFFNNAAVAAEAVLAADAVDSVAILDWDVHHGNGTQEVFYDRDDVLFVSLHNDHGSWDPAAHPQSGDITEDGVGRGEGYNVNVPLPPGTGDRGYALAFDRVVEPIVTAFDPDLVLVSAGQDAGTVDPLGRNVVTKAGFEALGARVRELAATCADGRLAVIQEGGYQQSHLGYATLGVFEGVLGLESTIEDPFDWLDEDVDSTRRALTAIVDHYASYWPLES